MCRAQHFQKPRRRPRSTGGKFCHDVRLPALVAQVLQKIFDGRLHDAVKAD
jgi:hypothetical protein